MKKKYIIGIIIIILVVFGISRIDFSSAGNNGNTDSSIVINKDSNDEKAKKITYTIDTRVLNEKENYDKLSDELKKYVNDDGYIIKDLKVEITKDHTVVEVLDAIAKEKDINIEYASMEKMSYVEAINHIGAKAVGDMSGWLYQVNGEFPSTGINDTELKDGDVVTFIYTADGGNDIANLK